MQINAMIISISTVICKLIFGKSVKKKTLFLLRIDTMEMYIMM